MGSVFCCDSTTIKLHTEDNSEMVVNSLEAATVGIDKSFHAYPFPNMNSELVENSSERISERFRFP
jgi:hypothetical protein